MPEQPSCSPNPAIAGPPRHRTKGLFHPDSDLRPWDGHESARPATSNHHRFACLERTTRNPNGRSHLSKPRSRQQRVVYQGNVSSAKTPPISVLGATTMSYRTRGRNQSTVGSWDGSDRCPPKQSRLAHQQYRDRAEDLGWSTASCSPSQALRYPDFSTGAELSRFG